MLTRNAPTEAGNLSQTTTPIEQDESLDEMGEYAGFVATMISRHPNLRGVDITDSQKRTLQFRPQLSLFLDVLSRAITRTPNLQAGDDLVRYYALLENKSKAIREVLTSAELGTILRAISGREWEPATVELIPEAVALVSPELGAKLEEAEIEELDALRDMLVKCTNAGLNMRSASDTLILETLERVYQSRQALLEEELRRSQFGPAKRRRILKR